MHYIIRHPPFGNILLEDNDFIINLDEKKDPNDLGVIIATMPVTNENWHSFQPGQLMVIQNGNIIYE